MEIVCSVLDIFQAGDDDHVGALFDRINWCVMALDKDSGRLWRRLGTVCVISGLALVPLTGWIALPVLACGLGFGVPYWFGSSWPDLLKTTGTVLRRASRPADRPSPPSQPGENQPAQLHERSPRVRGKASEDLPIFFNAWPFPHRAPENSEATLRPQNCIRLAAEVMSPIPSREKPIQAEPEEMIDLQTILENLEKHRAGRSASRSQEREQPAPDETPVTIDVDDIRRRLMASYARQLSGSMRQPFSNSSGENPQGGSSGTGQARDIAPASKLAMPSGVLSAKGKAAGEPPGSNPPAHQPGNGFKVGIDSAFWARKEGSKSATEGAALPSNHLPPAQASTLFGQPLPANAPEIPATEEVWKETALNREPVNGGVEFVSAREHSCEPVSSAVPCEPCAPGNERSGPPVAESGKDVGLPPLSLLRPAESAIAPMSQDDLIDGGILIEEKLAEFRVKVNVLDAYAGPVITRYEVQPAVGVRGGQVVSLMKDLARALGLAAIRVVETIPGKTCMGLELPNQRRQMIRLSEVLSSEVFQSHSSKLALVLGKDIIGEPVVADLARAPHMLVAGTTGSGKSVGLNAMILSLLYRATPEEVRFVMIDPKMLELSIYDGIPHLLAPVVTDMKLAANALDWCVREMERRYCLMSGLRVRNLEGYNQKVREAVETGERLIDPFSANQEDPDLLTQLPYIVVVVDELADLMLVAGKKIEELIARLAQKARAAGIHLIIATQRPSVDVITGLIKANIPTRIAFQVSSKIDSRTILDQMGAECLLGQGDMLYLPPGTGYPQRVHGAFVADEEVSAAAEYLKQFGEPRYEEGVLGGADDAEEGEPEAERFGEDSDPLYDTAVEFVISSRRASISAVQRQFRIGYNRAARLVEQMEASGLVSPMESNGNRTVLVPARQE